MQVAKTIRSVRKAVDAAKKQGKTIGFVPTMGALHVGHTSLMKAAANDCDFVVVSIFVNPAQFGAGEDYQNYPRPLSADMQACRDESVDLVFVPVDEQMYPTGNLTWVNVEKLTESLCGRFRPGHFRGVATVCAKLFNIVRPDYAYFGRKDAQQAVVIKRMVADLNMPVKIIVCPTVRQNDGLAISSRNKYLTDKQKQQATLIYKSLQKARQLVDSGIGDAKIISREMRKILKQADSIRIQYINIVNPDTLEEIKQITDMALVAVAVKIGSARLIDNILVDASKG